jgi:hypothetical protein
MCVAWGVHYASLSQALLTKISWSNDSGLAMSWHPNWHRGTWAGARIDLVLLSDIEDIDNWKDITEETFKDYWKAAILDERIDERCKCQLCRKYRRMCRSKEEKNKGKGDEEGQGNSNETQRVASKDGKPNLTKAMKSEVGCKPSFYQRIISSKESKNFGKRTHLSILEKIPYEVFDLISSQLPHTSLTACALASHSTRQL